MGVFWFVVFLLACGVWWCGVFWEVFSSFFFSLSVSSEKHKAGSDFSVSSMV